MTDDKGWTPGSSRNKRKAKERWQIKQQREYLDSLSTIQYKRLRSAIKQKEEGIKPPDVTLSTWENLQKKGYDWVGRLRKELLGSRK